jgi:hypothetical protein
MQEAPFHVAAYWNLNSATMAVVVGLGQWQIMSYTPSRHLPALQMFFGTGGVGVRDHQEVQTLSIKKLWGAISADS